MSYDIKYRERTIEYRTEGHTIAQTCEVFKISSATLKRWAKKYKETGNLQDSPAKRKPKKIDPDELKSYVAARPDAYQHEMAKVFDRSRKAIWQALRKHGITLKKDKAL